MERKGGVGVKGCLGLREKDEEERNKRIKLYEKPK